MPKTAKTFTFIPQDSNRFAEFSSKSHMGREARELLPLSSLEKHKIDAVSVTMTGLYGECYVDDEALMKERPQPNMNMGVRGICGNVISCKAFKSEDSFGGVTKISLKDLLAMSPEDRTHGRWPSPKKGNTDEPSALTSTGNEESPTEDDSDELSLQEPDQKREPPVNQPPEKKQKINKDE